MHTHRLQNLIASFAIFSELSHVFCCVLPSVFTIATVLVGMGAIGAIPLWMEDFHIAMHGWEIPMIIFSASILAMGWFVYFYTRRVKFYTGGCGHDSCDSRKVNNGRILKIATVLFLVNIAIYGVTHFQTEKVQGDVFSSSHEDHSDHSH